MSILTLQLLLLILVANGAPIIGRNIFQKTFNQPIDAGRILSDGNPVFGSSKTWRGVCASLLMTVIVAYLLDLGIATGLLVSTAAMTGDLLASFIKRRLGLVESSMAILLDQVPESLFPAILLMQVKAIHLLDVTYMVIAFIILELVMSWLLFKIGVRRRPY